MTERVPADEIENIVGRKRSVKDHYARAVSAEQTVYILHSRECLAMHAEGNRQRHWLRHYRQRYIEGMPS